MKLFLLLTFCLAAVYADPVISNEALLKAINNSIKNDKYCITAYSDSLTNKPSRIEPVVSTFQSKVLSITYPKDIDPYSFDSPGPFAQKMGTRLMNTKAQLDSLAKANLLKINSGITDDGKNKYFNYSLTTYGKTFAQTNLNNINSMKFCYGSKEALKIVNYAEITKDGLHGLRIKYEFKYNSIPEWAKNKEVIATTPELRALPIYDNIELIKTRNGWQTGLY